MNKDRAGKFVNQPTGYSSFVPEKLPPNNPPLVIDNEMFALLSAADRKLGRLDGITQILPNPELFVAMYVNKEAVLSSQIEGTQASLIDILEIDQMANITERPINEVINYVKAMNYGLERIKSFPLSLRLIREIHAELMAGARGENRNPGEFRKSQNWIGPANSVLTNATFVPPIVPDMMQALYDLEYYFYDSAFMPSLIKIALIHAQFETIHPFLDGNGRMGRLLITFWLCNEKILSQPLLYLSYYFKLNRQEYYHQLMNIRLNGDWESWVKFFLRGIAEVSDEAIESAKKIIELKERHSFNFKNNNKKNNYQRLLDLLFEQPVITKNQVSKMLNIALPTANTIVNDFYDFKILSDITPNKERYKKYIFLDYMAILQKGTEL